MMELDGSNSDIHIFGKDGDMCSPLENDSERDVLSKQNVDRDKVFSLTSSSLNVSLEHEIRDKVVQELQAPTKEFHDLRSSARQLLEQYPKQGGLLLTLFSELTSISLIHTLELSRMSLDDIQLCSLLSAPPLARCLKALKLRECPLVCDWGKALSVIATLEQIKVLDVSRNPRLVDSSLYGQSLPPTLLSLHMGGNEHITSEAVRILLATTPELECLTLSHTRIGDDCLSELCTANPKIMCLKLSYTSITDRCISHLLDLARLHSIEYHKTRLSSQLFKQRFERRPDIRGISVRSDVVKTEIVIHRFATAQSSVQLLQEEIMAPSLLDGDTVLAILRSDCYFPPVTEKCAPFDFKTRTTRDSSTPFAPLPAQPLSSPFSLAETNDSSSEFQSPFDTDYESSPQPQWERTVTEETDSSPFNALGEGFPKRTRAVDLSEDAARHTWRRKRGQAKRRKPSLSRQFGFIEKHNQRENTQTYKCRALVPRSGLSNSSQPSSATSFSSPSSISDVITDEDFFGEFTPQEPDELYKTPLNIHIRNVATINTPTHMLNYFRDSEQPTKVTALSDPYPEFLLRRVARIMRPYSGKTVTPTYCKEYIRRQLFASECEFGLEGYLASRGHTRDAIHRHVLGDDAVPEQPDPALLYVVRRGGPIGSLGAVKEKTVLHNGRDVVEYFASMKGYELRHVHRPIRDEFAADLEEKIVKLVGQRGAMVTAAYMKDTLRPQLFRSRRKADGFSGLRLDGWEVPDLYLTSRGYTLDEIKEMGVAELQDLLGQVRSPSKPRSCSVSARKLRTPAKMPRKRRSRMVVRKKGRKHKRTDTNDEASFSSSSSTLSSSQNGPERDSNSEPTLGVKRRRSGSKHSSSISQSFVDLTCVEAHRSDENQTLLLHASSFSSSSSSFSTSAYPNPSSSLSSLASSTSNASPIPSPVVSRRTRRQGLGVSLEGKSQYKQFQLLGNPTTSLAIHPSSKIPAQDRSECSINHSSQTRESGCNGTAHISRKSKITRHSQSGRSQCAQFLMLQSSTKRDTEQSSLTTTERKTRSQKETGLHSRTRRNFPGAGGPRTKKNPSLGAQFAIIGLP